MTDFHDSGNQEYIKWSGFGCKYDMRYGAWDDSFTTKLNIGFLVSELHNAIESERLSNNNKTIYGQER